MSWMVCEILMIISIVILVFILTSRKINSTALLVGNQNGCKSINLFLLFPRIPQRFDIQFTSNDHANLFSNCPRLCKRVTIHRIQSECRIQGLTTIIYSVFPSTPTDRPSKTDYSIWSSICRSFDESFEREEGW